MIIYIAGQITNRPSYHYYFDIAEKKLRKEGNVVLKPSVLPLGLKSHDSYMKICMAMLNEADAIYMLKGYQQSQGALMELEHAKRNGKQIIYE